MKILVIEDDAETAAYISNGLKEHGHVIDLAATGRDGLFMMIVDRMLPEIDGLQIVRTMRSGGVKTPVLFLTTLSGVHDRVAGLDAGGDDYLSKPFAFSELVARINALARRPPFDTTTSILRVADLTLDLIKRTLVRAGQSIELQPREFRLLEYLMRHSDEVVTRTMLLEHVWEFHFDPHTNVVETHISRLRAKVDRPFYVAHIHTVRGSGYSNREPDHTA